MSSDFYRTAIEVQIAKARVQAAVHGWAFKERDFDGATMGDRMGAIWDIDNPQDARRFFDAYVEWLSRRADRTEPPESVARSNIGWMFGEGMPSERIAMWVEAIDAAHPVFGTMLTPPTPEQALEAGRRLAEDAAR